MLFDPLFIGHAQEFFDLRGIRNGDDFRIGRRHFVLDGFSAVFFPAFFLGHDVAFVFIHVGPDTVTCITGLFLIDDLDGHASVFVRVQRIGDGVFLAAALFAAVFQTTAGKDGQRTCGGRFAFGDQRGIHQEAPFVQAFAGILQINQGEHGNVAARNVRRHHKGADAAFLLLRDLDLQIGGIEAGQSPGIPFRGRLVDLERHLTFSIDAPAVGIRSILAARVNGAAGSAHDQGDHDDSQKDRGEADDGQPFPPRLLPLHVLFTFEYDVFRHRLAFFR